MLLRSFRLIVPCAAALVVTAGGPRAAFAEQAPTKAECLAAYTSGQQLKKRGELRSAREQLLVCSRDPCPTALQADCNEWLSEVQRLQPSIVVVASDPSGRELTNVKVFVDDVEVASRLDGRAIDVDPGDRRLRFEAEGFEPVVRQMLVREGQKAREVTVRFARADAPRGGHTTELPVVPPKPEDPSDRPVPWTVWAAGGVSLVALGTFAGFGIAGVSERSELLDTCGHRCADDQKASVDRKFLVADVALGVALVAGAAAAVLFLTRGSGSHASSASVAAGRP